jgi:hypothetical protein
VRQARVADPFPLLCTHRATTLKAAPQAYRFQARLEKRFCQFKSIHRAAPLLFKTIRRVEANMFAFFLALLIQALLERELRQKLNHRKAPPLKLYPEDRDAPHCERLLVQQAFGVHRSGKMLVPIIGDAHLMPTDCLRKLRLLCEDFPRSRNLIPIGQPPLLQSLSLAAPAKHS